MSALARDLAQLAELVARGVDVRQDDYFDPASLERAFRGIDRLLFISAVTFTDMIAQHRNIVAAAGAADGVAEQFWRLHNAEPKAWAAEANYP